MIEPIARVKITLEESHPPIWRRVDVPMSASLMALHDIIQVAFRWKGGHLFEFRIGEKVYGKPHPEDEAFGRKVYQAKSLRLETLIGRGVGRFQYVYDFGDNWRHDLVIETIMEGSEDIDYPVFVAGARRAPPEDVGGMTGFMEFLEAVLDTTHEEHARMLTWYGRPFDPSDIDEKRIRMVLGMFADRRRGPLMSHRSGGRGRKS